MNIHWPKAIGYAAGLWGIIFIGVSALMVAPIPILAEKLLEIVIVAIGSLVLAYLYFKDQPGTPKDGLVLAAVWLVVGTILDLLVTIQYVKGSGTYLDGLKIFYGMWNVWVGFVLMFGACALAAFLNRRANPSTSATVNQPPVPPPMTKM